MIKVCKICGNKQHGKEYCSKHYQQLKRCGKILSKTIFDKNKIIIKKEGIYLLCPKEKHLILVDSNDLPKVENIRWKITPYGYAYNKKHGFMHRLLLSLQKGDPRICDHLNRNRLDNRKKNLRIITRGTNPWNRGLNKNNSSGHIGVTFHKGTKSWHARIGAKGKEIWGTPCKTKEEAIKMRKDFEKRYWVNK